MLDNLPRLNALDLDRFAVLGSIRDRLDLIALGREHEIITGREFMKLGWSYTTLSRL